eukprot:jgi/Botrbrau1/8703/Bobra.0311s0016.1
MVKIEKILLVATSTSRLGDTDVPTGAWLEELAVPFYYFLRKGYVVDVASIRGGKIPIDPLSLQEPHNKQHLLKRFISDVEAQKAFERSVSIVYVRPEAYDAIVITGGHGITWDGTFNAELKTLIERAYLAGRVIGAIGHGSSTLIQAETPDGRSIVEGRQITGVSNREEEHSKTAALIPFLVENGLIQAGAVYVRGHVDFRPFVTRSGQIITGQNSASALATAQMVVEALSHGVRLTI